MTVSLRTSSSSFGSSSVRTSSPVSVGLCTIETGGTKLAQRQRPRDSQRFTLAAKVPKSASAAARIQPGMSSPTSDPRWLQQRSSRDVTWRATRPQGSSLSCCPNETAARSGDIDRARPALHPV
jgi:hypothetical protein